MPIRMSGLMSGLDTDAIIKDLMSAQSTKKTKIEQKKTKLEWKQEKWAELNTKIYKLYTEQISKLRLAGSYGVKKATSSNEAAVIATATTSAGSGTHQIRIDQLASAQYVTGVKVDASKNIKNGTKLADIGMATGTVIKITSGRGDNAVAKALEVTGTTTVFDLVSTMKEAGLNASFDEAQGRFFINGKNSGAENAFSIEAFEIQTDAANNLAAATADLINSAGITEDVAASYRKALEDLAKKQEAYKNASTSDKEAATKNLRAAEEKVEELEESFYTGIASKKVQEDRLNALKAVGDGTNTDPDLVQAYNEIKNSLDPADQGDTDKIAKALEAAAEKYVSTDAGKKAVEAEVKALKGATPDVVKNAIDNYRKNLTEYNNGISNAIENNDYTGWVAKSGELENIGLSNISVEFKEDASGQLTATATAGNGVVVTNATDAKIVLDGAELTGTSNDFTVAGVTYNLKNTTAGATANITVTNDTQAVYDTVKDFIKQYNELLKEMNTLYNADSAKGYEPLSDEEKEAMSDKQVELWEKKIKDSLLRRDDSLNGVISTMRSSLQTSVVVNGKSYILADFGITTGEYTEKGLLHIYGDKEDSDYASKEDRLMKLFSENPEDAGKALSGIVQNLYSSLQNKMKGTSVSSALTFYNDKQMKKDISNYAKDISKWETKLQDMEERYYKQFSAMETALSKLQSQSNYLASLMGGGQ